MTDDIARQADRWLRGVEREWQEWYAAHRRGDHRGQDNKEITHGD